MPSSQLPLKDFPAWARINVVSFGSNVALQDVKGKGFGLVATTPLSAEETLLQIPRDIVLSADAVDEYAKVDQNFKQLLQSLGSQSPRIKILLYLVTHLVLSSQGSITSRGGVATAWTEYTKFIPRAIPVPTMWSSEERSLLQGTSLEDALSAKLTALLGEFEELREKSSDLPYWNELLWDNDTIGFDEWILVDAWYRSRCLEMPEAGDSMVPALDMVNHSHDPTAYYEEGEDGDVRLLLRPGHTVPAGSEVTISYGQAKPAAEMLFSYGFIDPDTVSQELTLPIDTFADDPLGKAKRHVFGQPPVVKLSHSDGHTRWDSPFAFLMCLNEEDGLEFRILQDTEGGRSLELFWQDEEVTSRAHEFETLIKDHPLRQLFRLRVVAVLCERVAAQLESMNVAHDTHALEEERVRDAKMLKDIEKVVLQGALETLETQRSQLMEDDDVVKYLGRAEEEAGNDTPPWQAEDAAANSDLDEFS